MALESQKMNLDYIRTFVVLGQSKSMYEASKKRMLIQVMYQDTLKV